MIDFEFDGEFLSEHNCVVGSFVTSQENAHLLFSEMNLNTVKNQDINQIVSINYPSVLTKTFDIIKNNCYDINDSNFSELEVSEIVKWLNKSEYKRFRPIYNDDPSDGNFIDIHFYGTFTSISILTLCGKTIGFSLTFTSNAPYGFGEKIVDKRIIKANDNLLKIYNNSQNSDYLYFDEFKIKCKSDGDIDIFNITDPTSRHTIISNCVENEVITLNCKTRLIQSSENHIRLYNDFNYFFPRLYTEDSELVNDFVFDIEKMSECEVEYSYEPVIKIGVII